MNRTRQPTAATSSTTPRAPGRVKLWAAVGLGASVALGCSADSQSSQFAVSAHALEQRAYVVSRESDELTVLDLDSMEILDQVPTGGVENHMAELSADFSKVYVTSSGTD